MKVSRWYTRSRDRDKDKTIATLIPAISHTLNCGLLVFYDEEGRKLSVTLTYAEYHKLLSEMQSTLENTYAITNPTTHTR